MTSLTFFVRDSGWGIEGPKNRVAELTLVRRSRASRLCGDCTRGAAPEGRRERGRDEPVSTELTEEFELRRSRRVTSEGNAIAPGV